MNRRDFVQSAYILGVGAAISTINLPTQNNLKTPIGITMWDFSWIERRWVGAGYENWDIALKELQQRGYKSIRIDAFPHLIYKNPEKEYLLKPAWSTQDWGSPAINKINLTPNLINFIKKCKEYDIKIGLSTWWREDEDKSYKFITTPEKLGEVWLSVLNMIDKHGLLNQIIYVDLSNEWPLRVWTPFKNFNGWWDAKESIKWMKGSIDILRKEYPSIPYTFSFTGELTKDTLNKGDVSMLDFLEPHIWMVNYKDGEFYKKVGYNYERFSYEGYDNLALKGEKLYRENENYWKDGLYQQIDYAAQWSKLLNKPLVTTECWGVVDYKDWPLLNWGWVKELCEIGTLEALKTGRWGCIATSNFCGPQFKGMWTDVEWHLNLTKKINSFKLSEDISNSLLCKRF